jgi:membrane-bound lytic murein transglycosylase D
MWDYLKIIFLICLGILCAQVEPTEGDFPLTKNKEISRQLKIMKHSSKHFKSCLKNMKKHRKLISKKLEKQKMPQELLAIPIIESCYQNIHSKYGWGSGIWMLIKPTAKSLGLKVNKKVDQRMDVARSTDAALKYLKQNHKILKDWELTVMAYNMGENKVLKAIKKTGTRDAWKLVRKGHERDKGYLAKVVAAAILINEHHD